MKNWSLAELERFLEVRQEFFLDPAGSNKQRFLEAANILQKALFDWYLSSPGVFKGLKTVIPAMAEQWSALRSAERQSLHLRRFTLNSPTPELPAVEGSVSEHQWQRIRGSLGLGLTDPGSLDRFLIQLDEETNPSLRVNHRYVGELLPHDNMISYLSAVTATFLNENAIIGKVSPCVTHMEQAAIDWLLTLVGWDSCQAAVNRDEAAVPGSTNLPIQRLPTLTPPAQEYLKWDREQPTGAVVAGGTIANISAMLIARNAVFDYLLAWPGAVQWLGPITAWNLIREAFGFTHLVVATSRGAHYSVAKAALQAGVARGNVVELSGSENPWILDGTAMTEWLASLNRDPKKDCPLLMAVVPVAGKTETGYVDRIAEIAEALDSQSELLPTYSLVIQKAREFLKSESIRHCISALLEPDARVDAQKSYDACSTTWRKEAELEPDSDFMKLKRRLDGGSEFQHSRHNRPFMHVDAAHGAAFMTIPALVHEFAGIELADTITVDGHKSFYCYYPCGGLLVRTKRWAKTFSTEGAAYITEDELIGSYREHYVVFGEAVPHVGQIIPDAAMLPDPDGLLFDSKRRGLFEAVRQLVGRPTAARRSELTHNPFNEYLEGSRGPQGIMQLYFNLSTLGLSGYKSVLGWTVLLRERLEEAVSLGLTDVRLVTDPPVLEMKEALCLDARGGVPQWESLQAIDKRLAILAGRSEVPQDGIRPAAIAPTATLVPTAGGRFLRLSGGTCNQVLITYVPAHEAKLIAAAPIEYWNEQVGRRQQPRILRTMKYLWRVNEHLWHEHLYANPHFTYYVGHTTLQLPKCVSTNRVGEEAPGSEGTLKGRIAMKPEVLASLLTGWNAWTKQATGECPFFQVLCESARKPSCMSAGSKFFCHKVVVMHPYTDESLLGDMLRRMTFWGERSVLNVTTADMTARFLFPDEPQNAESQA